MNGSFVKNPLFMNDPPGWTAMVQCPRQVSYDPIIMHAGKKTHDHA
ncbi:hypothetical protein GXY_14582 [Novacetimonas hansenii ATCC 23769]|uniref:Uncharacterized protein n=1 Tax=Novacetimonas hansenii ATCC 23769 TaxID=714995 RepID=D5QID5_NOVHA|nr:hypothetical protein GXY_14582 [Novacetimonas hansenii ATCC 23769]